MKLTWAQRQYLAFVQCPPALSWQNPEYIAAKWWHFLWMLVPIMGILLVDITVQHAYENERRT